MQLDWLIIDGYNLLHQSDALTKLIKSDLMLARHRMVRLLEKTALRMAPQTTVVFDGKDAGSDESLTTSGLEIYFSPSNLSADTVIERLVSRYAHPERILVVTSDHAEHVTVASAGAQVMSSREFLAQCELDISKTVPRRTRPGEQPRLGDLFPENG